MFFCKEKINYKRKYNLRHLQSESQKNYNTVENSSIVFNDTTTIHERDEIKKKGNLRACDTKEK